MKLIQRSGKSYYRTEETINKRKRHLNCLATKGSWFESTLNSVVQTLAVNTCIKVLRAGGTPAVLLSKIIHSLMGINGLAHSYLYGFLKDKHRFKKTGN
jgi:hypothetical protein